KGAVPDANSMPRQVTLSRRTVSEIKVNPGQRGAATKTVNVEVRQKRTYVKRSAVEVDAQADSERAEALRKLEESRSQREAEQMVLLETDRKRKEEEARQREAEEARKLAEEEKRRSEEEARRKALEEAAANAPAPVEAGIPAAVPVEPPTRDAERPKRS